jgi:hypothetical protein
MENDPSIDDFRIRNEDLQPFLRISEAAMFYQPCIWRLRYLSWIQGHEFLAISALVKWNATSLPRTTRRSDGEPNWSYVAYVVFLPSKMHEFDGFVQWTLAICSDQFQSLN